MSLKLLQFLAIVWREITQSYVWTLHFSCKGIMAVHVALLTSLIQEMKVATRVKTVGLWGVLQPRPSTKLVTPCTYHLPSLPLQFRGPPESPWKIMADIRANKMFYASSEEWSCVVVPHVARWLALSTCTDHGCLCWAAPPVTLTTDTVIHHRK